MRALGLQVSTNVGNGEDCGSAEHLSHDMATYRPMAGNLSSTFHYFPKFKGQNQCYQTDLDSTRITDIVNLVANSHKLHVES